jgi:hypothetical protein
MMTKLMVLATVLMTLVTVVAESIPDKIALKIETRQ